MKKKMKIRCFLSLMVLLVSLSATAQETAKKHQPVFTVVRENPITSIKNQNKSGTCWDYATIGFLESEILRKTGKTYDLSEMFVANKDYVDCAEYHVRLHGDSRFSEGGSCDDVVDVICHHGICPESAMAAPGSLVGDSLANFNEFFSVLEPYVDAVAKSNAKKLSPQWKAGLQGILDSYLGKCPDTFVYEGKSYIPQTFSASLGLNLDDYVSMTSFTHHPFRTWFVIEAPYKWRPKQSYNIPLQELMDVIDGALEKGYNVAWGGDVSGDDFSRQGLAMAYDAGKAQSMAGSDKARWLKLNPTDRRTKLDSLGVDAPELVPTQEMRQEFFDDWESTYDHVMVIYGQAKDQNGREYYMVKNSWGSSGDYKGTWYMSKKYMALFTTYIFLNKNALPDALKKEVESKR